MEEISTPLSDKIAKIRLRENLMHCYQVRQSFVILIVKILILEIVLISIHLFFQELSFATGWHEILMGFSAANTIELVFFHLINVVVLLILLMSWFTTYYTITPKEIIITTGILNKKQSSDDIRGMQELEISQGIWGRLFDYGTLRLKSPMWRADAFFKNIPTPQKYSGIIEKYRAQAIAENPLTNIFPKQN